MTPELIGHRGARGLFPENTLEGLRAAIALGVTAFEIDVGMTRDGTVVLSHDPLLNPDITRHRGTWLGAPGPAIARLTLAELAAFDVGRIRPGSPTAARFPEQAPADRACIPTLAAVLQLDGVTQWIIEIKTFPPLPTLTAPPDVIAEAVAAAADAAGAASRVVVQSFDWRGPRHLRRLRPQLRFAWLGSTATAGWRADPGLTWPEAIVAEGGGTWSPEHSELTRPDLDAAHRLGLHVVPWTVNSPADAQRLAAWGVDGLITDRPDVLRAALPPPPYPAR